MGSVPFVRWRLPCASGGLVRQKTAFSTNPSQLPEITRMDLHTSSAASLLSGGVLSPGRKTMKDYEQQQKNLEQENFQLKLRIYMLEERLQGNSTPDSDTNMIVDLKVQLATLREELAQKKELLRRASDTLESLEQQHSAELEWQRRQGEEERRQLERRVAELQAALERAVLERTSPADERSAFEQPYLRAFEPLGVAEDRHSEELSRLEARTEELRDALQQMKQTAEERDRETEQLHHQLEEARAAAALLPELEQRCQRVSEELRQLHTERERGAAETERLSRQLELARAERDGRDQQLKELQDRLEQAEREPEELRRTCERLTAGRAADGARLAEIERERQRDADRIKAAEANEVTLKAALQSVGAQLVERKAELVAARRAQRRSAAHIEALIGEQRKQHITMKQYLAAGTGGPEGGQTDPAPDPETGPDQTACLSSPAALCGGGAAPSPPLTPHEVQVYLLRTETQRKDRKIRSMVAEMKQMNDLLVKYRWEVKELAEEENERLWTELEENKKLIRELQDEKMELVLEKERQIQRLLAQLKERTVPRLDGDRGGGGPPGLQNGTPHRSPSDESLQEAHTQVLSLRSQLAHATLLVGERDSEIGRLRERLLQQRRLLDEPLPSPQLRQRLSHQLGELCAELAAPRAGVSAELGGAGEAAAGSSHSAAGRSDDSQLGSEKVDSLRAQLSDLRDQLLVKDRQLAEREESHAEAERLQRVLDERERELTAAGRQLAETAGTADRLREAELRLAAADTQLQELAELRETLASRERELTLAEGQLNEIAELREQLETRDQQLAAGAEQRHELLQTRQLLAERDQEKTALLKHLDQLRREHQRETRELREKFELAITAPAREQHLEAEVHHTREEARLRRRLADTQAAAELLQRRLEQLADFLELLLGLEEQGVIDLSCLTAQHMAELQRSLVQSRELSQSLTQSMLLGPDGTLDVSVADQSSLHVPELEPAREGTASVPTPAPREARKAEETLPGAAEEAKPDSPRLSPVGEAQGELSAADQPQETQSRNTPRRVSFATAAAAAVREPEVRPTPAADVTEAEIQACWAPDTAEQATQAVQPTANAAQTTERPAQTTGQAVQTSQQTSQTCERSVSTVDRTVQTAERPVGKSDRPVQTEAVSVLPACEPSQLEQLSAQLAGRDAQLLQQAQLVAELRRQLERQLQPAAAAPGGGGGGDERVAALPGNVRDRLRTLVQRQLTSERASGTDSATAVERAISPLLRSARAQSAQLMGLGTEPQPTEATPSRSSGQLMPPPPPPEGPTPVPTAEETPTPAPATAVPSAATAVSPSAPGSRHSHSAPLQSQDRAPAPADWSESDAWSEPDRDVSLARIGLDQSSLGTRTESWLAQATDSDAKRSRRRQRGSAGSQQAQDLEAHIEGLHQVKDALRAEVDIYQKVLPPVGQRPKHSNAQADTTGVLVPREVLAEIHNLQQQLERAIAANERIRRQLELELPPAAPAELARTLQVTEQRLSESTQQLTASQERCDQLRAKLSRAKDNLRLAQLNAEEFKDKFVRVSDDLVRLRERFTQLEADRERTSEESRYRPRSPPGEAVRRLEVQLETAQAALRRQQQLSEELRQQLLSQRPSPETATAGSCSETQLLEINREKLRLLGERAQLASRGRLLRSESCLLEDEAREAAAHSRLEAAKWAGWALERQQLQQEVSQLTERLAAAEAEADRRVTAEAEAARLTEEHSHCQRRLTELSTAMNTDKRRLQEVSAQLEEVNAQMDAMRRKLNDIDDAGQGVETARSCVPPSHHQPEPEPEQEPKLDPVMRRSTSESDGHDVHQESDLTSAYSSPDLGIESDCCRVPSRPGRQPQTETAGGGTAEPASDTSETERLRQERDMIHSKLTATRAALQQALDKLSRADQRKARVERAIYRQLSKTHDILRRAKNNLAPPGAGVEPAGAPQ